MICRNILHSFAFLPHYFVSMFHVPQIDQNIAISLAIVAFLVVTALIGVMPLTLGLIINEGSALIIIANAMFLRRYQWKKEGIRTKNNASDIPLTNVE